MMKALRATTFLSCKLYVCSWFALMISGIGIDDMFVIMQCLSNLSDQQKSTLPLPEQIGQAMRHAGVAISITSLTDVCAFGVGAITVSSLYKIRNL